MVWVFVSHSRVDSRKIRSFLRANQNDTLVSATIRRRARDKHQGETRRRGPGELLYHR